MIKFNKRDSSRDLDSIAVLKEGMAAVEEMLKTIQGVGEKDRELEQSKTLPVELFRIAAVLKEQEMPQATINMCLAARCGLPIVPVDTRSPYICWTDDEPKIEQ